VARRAGFTNKDIAGVIADPAETRLGKHESVILRGVDELYTDAMISDDTWNTLSESWSSQQLMEFPVLIGQYQAVAYYQNALRLRLHKGNEGLNAR
jgi:alkylhydroperoxidase family enzyme